MKGLVQLRKAFMVSAGLVCLLAAGGPAVGQDAAKGKLAGDPAVTKTDAGFEIAFALTAPNDVTVRVVDAKGEVVRHLASGVVGLAKAARPFADDALAQKLVWDGKDDAGKAADPSSCKAVVAVGMSAKFDKFLLYQRDAYEPARSIIAKGAGDEWLVNEAAGIHLCTMRAFNSEGKFLRAVWPHSLDKPKEALEKHFAAHNRTWNGQDAGQFGNPDWDGNMVPACVNHNARYWFGTSSPDTIITSDGYMVGINGMGADFTQLWQMTPEGLPGIWFWLPPWYKTVQQAGFQKAKWHLVAGKDGDFYLADAVRHVVGHFRASDFKPIDSFTQSGAKKLDAPRYYLGVPGQATAEGEAAFAGPDDIEVDADGNLLIAEGGSLLTYDKAGAFVKKADKPADFGKIAVPQAVRAAGRRDKGVSFPHFLRADGSGRLIVGHSGSTGDFIFTDVNGETYKPFRFDRAVGGAQEYNCLDSKGNWYVSINPGGKDATDCVWKYSPDGKRAKFGEKDQLDLTEGVHEIKGVHVGPNDDIYVVATWGKWRKPSADVWKFGNLALKGDKYNLTRVDVYSPEGALKHKGLIRSQGLNDVAVDREGNLYVIEATMWHGAQMSDTAFGRITGGAKAWPMDYLTAEQAKLDPMKEHNKRFSLLARVLKFAPTGGVMDGHDGLPGQLWSSAGVSGLSPWNCGGECYGGQLCLDADQRVWAPDTFMYNVKAVDGAGNTILRVGKYGNEDCPGGGGDAMRTDMNVVTKPEVPLARPSGIAVWKDYLLISDAFSHRIVRCRLEYAEKRELALK